MCGRRSPAAGSRSAGTRASRLTATRTTSANSRSEGGRRMRSPLRLPALLVVLAAAASLGPAAPAQAAGAHVVQGFGRDGTRFLPSSLPETSGLALLGGGRVLFAGGEE